ncbi:MAG TPA: ATP-binding protein, partial [Gemmatimonadaceae bacterium]|nr:ATP-binding protein [Gemmatimonadaceae bacterium]
RFFRAHEDTQGGIDGTGLGLSIVRETAASIGGRTWAEFLDDGTAFCFSIPSRRKADEAAVAAAGVESAT